MLIGFTLVITLLVENKENCPCLRTNPFLCGETSSHQVNFKDSEFCCGEENRWSEWFLHPLQQPLRHCPVPDAWHTCACIRKQMPFGQTPQRGPLARLRCHWAQWGGETLSWRVLWSLSRLVRGSTGAASPAHSECVGGHCTAFCEREQVAWQQCSAWLNNYF